MFLLGYVDHVDDGRGWIMTPGVSTKLRQSNQTQSNRSICPQISRLPGCIGYTRAARALVGCCVWHVCVREFICLLVSVGKMVDVQEVMLVADPLMIMQESVRVLVDSSALRRDARSWPNACSVWRYMLHTKDGATGLS